MPTTVPTKDWRKLAARNIAEFLAQKVTDNNGPDAGDHCFHGVTDADIASIIRQFEPVSGARGGGSGLAETSDGKEGAEASPALPADDAVVLPPKPAKTSKTAAQSALATQILSLIKTQNMRVSGLATALNQTPEAITAAIRAEGSGLEIARAGWVQEVL